MMSYGIGAGISMRLSITGQIRSRLARGGAVLVVGGIAAGCSSGASGLTDGLVTNSTSTSAPVAVAQLNQPYPGDVQSGRRSQSSGQRVLRPSVDVGGSMQGSSAPVALPPPVSPVYAAPAPAASRSTISSAPLPPPQGTQPQRAAAAPIAPRTPADPGPVQQNRQIAVLPQAPKPQEKSKPQGSAATTAANTFTGGSYTVVAGDTLYGVARKTGASVENIKRANGLSDGMIRIGQKLVIPSGTASAVQVAAAKPTSRPTVKAADPVTTGAALAAAPKTQPKEPDAPKVTAYTPPSVKEEAAMAANTELAALTPESTGVDRLRWPVRGRVISSFGSGSGSKNDGIDISVPEGTPIRAAENGVVIYSGDGLKGFGNTVLVRHEDGLVTVYGHASNLKVSRGDSVKRGQEIGTSGMTGDADMPKLHFEVRKGTSPVDPLAYLE